MRVTHVITRLIVGGAQENTVASVFGLQARTGWDVDLISGPTEGPEGSLVQAFAHDPQRLTILPQLVRPVHPWKDWIALRRLTQIFRESKPDIVHTHSGKAGILARVAADKARVPLILHTIHGPSFGPFQGPLSNRIFHAAERQSGKITTHFVSVADAMTNQYLRAGIGRPDQFTKILSGFDLKPFQSAVNDPGIRARWGISSNDIVIGKIARLFKLKGHDDLLSIAPALMEQCPAIKFLFVGDGAWRDRIAAKARALGLANRFVFTGLVSPADIPGLVGIMDVLVHVSRREGLPRALPQALAAARPIVAYDCDGAREVCLDSETGFLLAPGDLQGLSARLLSLARDPVLRLRLGKRGQDLVLPLFALDTMIDRLCELYARLGREHQIPVA